MNHFKIFTILLFGAVIFFSSCKEKAKTPTPKAKTANPLNFEPPQNAAGVWHFTCSKRCAGGSGAAGNCTTCGAPLIHNTLYHGNANSTPANAPFSTGPFATPPVNTSGQNAAGIWHYTCDQGCVGGSGAAGNCATCGNALTHNQAYH